MDWVTGIIKVWIGRRKWHYKKEYEQKFVHRKKENEFSRCGVEELVDLAIKECRCYRDASPLEIDEWTIDKKKEEQLFPS